MGDVLGLLEVGVGVRVYVGENYAAGFEEAYVLLEGCRVHGDEHVALVAGGVDAFADAYLEAADA